VVVSPADPAMVIRSADEFAREGDVGESSSARVLTMRVSAGAAPRRGDLIDLVTDLDHVYLFDAQTGASLQRGRVC
jgi:hypothetical protein